MAKETAKGRDRSPARTGESRWGPGSLTRQTPPGMHCLSFHSGFVYACQHILCSRLRLSVAQDNLVPRFCHLHELEYNDILIAHDRPIHQRPLPGNRGRGHAFPNGGSGVARDSLARQGILSDGRATSRDLTPDLYRIFGSMLASDKNLCNHENR